MLGDTPPPPEQSITVVRPGFAESARASYDIPMVANVVVVFVALLHLYFLVLEMFLWTRPAGRRVFRTTEEFARASATLAANQGLYNGFLAAALLWGVMLGPAGRDIRLFGLGCVVIAGVYGAATVNKRILYVQAVPGIIGFALTWLA